MVSITHESHKQRAYLLKTSRGYIRASKVIHCTNAYANYLIPNLRGGLYPLRGTMTEQKPSASFPRVGDKVSWSYFGKRSIDPNTKVCDLSLYYAQQNPQTGNVWIGGEVQPVNQLLSYDDSTIGEKARENIASIIPRLFDEENNATLVNC